MRPSWGFLSRVACQKILKLSWRIALPTVCNVNRRVPGVPNHPCDKHAITLCTHKVAVGGCPVVCHGMAAKQKCWQAYHCCRCLVLQGDLVLQQPWFNLSCQSPQPSLRLPSTSYDPFGNSFQETDTAANQLPLSASLCTELAFQLGSCLKIQGTTARPSKCQFDAQQSHRACQALLTCR